MKRWAINFNRAIKNVNKKYYERNNKIRERWKIVWKWSKIILKKKEKLSKLLIRLKSLFYSKY